MKENVCENYKHLIYLIQGVRMSMTARKLNQDNSVEYNLDCWNLQKRNKNLLKINFPSK